MKKTFVFLGVLAIVVGIIGVIINLIKNNWVFVVYDIALIIQGIALLTIFK